MPAQPRESLHDVFYSHRPRPLGSASEIGIEKGMLALSYRNKSQRVPLNRIEKIRLEFAPRHMAMQRYACKIWFDGGKSFSFSNIDWKSLVEFQRLDGDYTTLVNALIAGAPQAEVRAGRNIFIWALGLFFGAMISLILAVLALRTFMRGEWIISLLAGVFIAFFIRWSYEFFTRNRPELCAKGSIPPRVMPPAPASSDA